MTEVDTRVRQVAAASGCYLCGSSSTRLIVANATYSFTSCTSCGFRMQHPVPDAETSAELYGDDFYADRNLDRTLDEQDGVARSLIDERVRLLTRLNQHPGVLLDIGAGTGLFVEASSLAAWRATGIETSETAVRIARRVTTATVLHERLEDQVVEPKYDAVTLWDVLEHMPDPRASLNMILRLLKPDGLVAISLPNVRGMKARLLGTRWRYYRREFGHISHFSPATLTAILAQSGFQPVVVRTSGLFNLGKLFRLSPAEVFESHRVLSRLQRAADASAGRVGLGEDLLVVGRRTSA